MTIRTHSAARKYSNGRVKRLNTEALKVVEEKANEIAECLMTSTREGKVMSTRLLVELAEGSASPEEALQKRPLLTLAQRLAAAPQLPPEALD